MSSTANGIHSGKKCFTIIGLRLNNSQTLRNQTLLNMQTELIFSQEDSHAKMPPSQNNMEKASKDLMEQEQDCGEKWLEPLKNATQNMSLPRMLKIFSEPTMEEILQQSSVNWCEWGSIVNGECVEHQKSVDAITVPGASWLLTPTASDCNRANLSFPMWLKRYHRSEGCVVEQLHRLGHRGLLNHQFPLWMMGYPNNYTELPFLNGEQNQSKPQEMQ